MTSVLAHAAEARELEAMTKALEAEIGMWWRAMRRRRVLAREYASDEDYDAAAECAQDGIRAHRMLLTLFALRKAARKARRGTV